MPDADSSRGPGTSLSHHHDMKIDGFESNGIIQDDSQTTNTPKTCDASYQDMLRKRKDIDLDVRAKSKLLRQMAVLVERQREDRRRIIQLEMRIENLQQRLSACTDSDDDPFQFKPLESAYEMEELKIKIQDSKFQRLVVSAINSNFILRVAECNFWYKTFSGEVFGLSRRKVCETRSCPCN